MKLIHSFGFLCIAAFLATPVFADSNATGGGVVNSETVILSGTFSHAGAQGDVDNSTTTATFVGGFSANQVRFSGTLTSVVPATWASEADIHVESPFPFPPDSPVSFDWQNPGPGATYTTIDFDSSQAFGGSIDPAGTWDIEFFDTFDDAAGTDSETTNLEMTLEEVITVGDTNGSFALISLNHGDTAMSVGEFAVESVFDLYSVTLNEDGNFTFFTDEDPAGFVGDTVDTEIAIFDSAGVLIAEDDDSGNGLYSGIFDLALTAGDYTLAVAPFLGGTSFEDGPVVNPGTGTGDYSLTVSLSNPVPEPSSAMFLGVTCCGLVFRRRKK